MNNWREIIDDIKFSLTCKKNRWDFECIIKKLTGWYKIEEVWILGNCEEFNLSDCKEIKSEKWMGWNNDLIN